MSKFATLSMAEIDTPLGVMVAVGNNDALYLLEFADHANTPGKIKRLLHQTEARLVASAAKSIESIKLELELYFQGMLPSQLKSFRTPLFLLGSPFQKRVWQELQKIPYGNTRSYKEIAVLLGQPTAYRAVAQANGANILPIIIPCHRVIASDGTIGGYSGGLARKEWLLQHEVIY